MIGNAATLHHLIGLCKKKLRAAPLPVPPLCLPCLALPGLALPRRASPRAAAPRRAVPKIVEIECSCAGSIL
jgi:hypothetical protein